MTFVAIRRAAAVAAGIGVLAITLLGSADIAGRSLWDAPLLGQVEVTRILLVFIAFLGLAEAESAGGHVRLQLLDPLLSPHARWLLDGAVRAIAIAIVAVLGAAAASLFWESWSAGETMIAPIALPAWLAKGGVVVGFAIFGVELVRGLVQWVSAWNR